MEAHDSVISIKEARKLLGLKSRSMSDDEISTLIVALQSVASRLLETSLEVPLGS